MCSRSDPGLEPRTEGALATFSRTHHGGSLKPHSTGFLLASSNHLVASFEKVWRMGAELASNGIRVGWHVV